MGLAPQEKYKIILEEHRKGMHNLRWKHFLTKRGGKLYCEKMKLTIFYQDDGNYFENFAWILNYQYSTKNFKNKEQAKLYCQELYLKKLAGFEEKEEE